MDQDLLVPICRGRRICGARRVGGRRGGQARHHSVGSMEIVYIDEWPRGEPLELPLHKKRKKFKTSASNQMLHMATITPLCSEMGDSRFAQNSSVLLPSPAMEPTRDVRTEGGTRTRENGRLGAEMDQELSLTKREEDVVTIRGGRGVCRARRVEGRGSRRDQARHHSIGSMELVYIDEWQRGEPLELPLHKKRKKFRTTELSQLLHMASTTPMCSKTGGSGLVQNSSVLPSSPAMFVESDDKPLTDSKYRDTKDINQSPSTSTAAATG